MLLFSRQLLQEMEVVAAQDPLLCVSYLFLERVRLPTGSRRARGKGTRER